MKGEYSEDRDEHHHHNMFPKFSPPHLQNQSQNQPPPKFSSSHFPPHPFPFSVTKDSEEADSASIKKPKTATDDSGTVEVSRRPRGRPPGSKNKPKPPVFVTRESEPVMSPYILEIPGGSDIVDSLTRFTRRRGVGICVLAASGAVSNVSLKQPSTGAPAGTVTFHGRFDILSLSAVLLVQTVPFCGNSIDGRFAFTISLAGPQGQIVGGKVVGPLVCAGTVYVVAASFNSPSYHRLPMEEEEGQNPNQNQSACGGDARSESPVSGGTSGGGAMGMYSCHMGTGTSDVMWASPTARAPPPPPY